MDISVNPHCCAISASFSPGLDSSREADFSSRRRKINWNSDSPVIAWKIRLKWNFEKLA